MTDRRQQAEQRTLEDQHLDQRRAINDAYAALMGRAVTETYTSYTFEEALDQQIERLSGGGTATHPSAIEVVEKIRSRLASAVEQIKKIPPERFAKTPDSA